MIVSSQSHSGPFNHDLRLNITLGSTKSKGKNGKNSNSARSNNKDLSRENNKIKGVDQSTEKKKKKNIHFNKIQLTDHTLIDQSIVNPKLK